MNEPDIICLGMHCDNDRPQGAIGRNALDLILNKIMLEKHTENENITNELDSGGIYEDHGDPGYLDGWR
jgi:hypothetical protein